MKYRAVLSFDFDAFDHPELRRREHELGEWLKAFEDRFGAASMLVKERRPRRRPRVPAPIEVWTDP